LEKQQKSHGKTAAEWREIAKHFHSDGSHMMAYDRATQEEFAEKYWNRSFEDAVDMIS
jgi:hypothetical protein